MNEIEETRLAKAKRKEMNEFVERFDKEAKERGYSFMLALTLPAASAIAVSVWGGDQTYRPLLRELNDAVLASMGNMLRDLRPRQDGETWKD